MPEWTAAQQSAIHARNSNILVSAAAGSGKTAVLVERVVNLIINEENHVDIDKLLVVTFTNAAAAEMKNRISIALSKIIAKEPNNTNVLRQISLLPSAKICTIDSFCMNLVRENFYKLDIAQDFKILDNSEQLLIEQNAADEVIEEYYKTDSVDFKSFVELLSSAKNDSDLIKAIKRVTAYISAQPFPFDWLRKVCELYNPDVPIDGSPLKDYVFDEIEYNILFIKKMINECISSLCVDDEMFEEYTELLKSDLSLIESVEDALNLSWDELKNILDCLAFGNMPRSKKGYSGKAKALISDSRKQYKKIITDDILPLISASSDEIKSDNEYLYPIIKVFNKIIIEYSKKVMEIKKERNAYSFSDIEHFAIRLLFYKNDKGEIVRTDLAKEYEDTFYEILVDEYQDTNSAQDTLFEMLSNGHNRFMVGDIKQSIYRFRLAMPEIFNAKKEKYEPYSENQESIGKKIILDKNFRSRKGICDYTNFVFSHLMNKHIGELEYKDEEYLNYGACYEKSKIPSAQLNIVQIPEGKDADEYEARQIAKWIIKKIESGEKIKDGDFYRDICFGDFAVLFRSAKGRMPVFAKVFAEYAIPVSANNKTNLFDNNEVAILISLLRVVDNPSRDVPLLATLMSVFYGYSADDIAMARVKNRKGNLYSAICADRECFSSFLDDLEKYRKYAASMSVECFLRQVISDTSYLSVISAMGNCEQRRLNVMKLVELAKGFDKGENVGITAFMRYIDAIISAKLSIESASVSHTGDNSVSLMSIHQSKGLEFPICIFAGCSHKYNTESLKDLIQLNNEQGIGFKVYNEEGLFRYNSVQYSCIRNRNVCASMSENLRVLYVALTRAKEQFVSFISLKDDAEKYINSLSKKLVNSDISPVISKHIQSDGDFLLLCALLHKNGEKLRRMCSKDIRVDHRFDFDMSITFCEETDDFAKVEEVEIPPDQELIKEIEQRLSFSYERNVLSSFLSKRSASELDERERGYTFFAKSKPAFLSEAGMTAAQKGTAMHAFMQHCDYRNAKSDLENEIKRLVGLAFITQQQANSLGRDKLSHLFNSPFAKRMFESDHIYREIKVSSFVPANELENTEFTDNILVQGIADCVFEENGELILVDYKTDHVDSEEELLDLYKNQIAFYKKAVSKLFGKNVKEAMLYSFCLDKPCNYK